jgi:hypothetical protein
MKGTIILVCAAAMPITACTTGDQNMPLVFGRTQTVGIGVQGSAADGGGSVTLGFNDRNIAVVPTTSSNGTAIRSTSADGKFVDSLSVLGQFEARGSGRDVEARLGTFFSTGLAARNLAEGFRDEMRGFGQAAEDGMVFPHPNPKP